ncbi:MAG: hypothetical protein ACLT1J_14080 [Mediterraneibacter gnavus]
MMTRLRRYEENVELIFKILYFLLAAGTFCPFIYDSSLQPILVKMVLGSWRIFYFSGQRIGSITFVCRDCRGWRCSF